jgi:hypothetical protein
MQPARWQRSVVAGLAVMSLSGIAAAARPVKPRSEAGASPAAKADEKAPEAAPTPAAPPTSAAPATPAAAAPAAAAPAAPATEPARPAEPARGAEVSQAAEKTPETPKAPPPEPAERTIEKREGTYVFRLTLRPGNLKPARVADVTLELLRVLDIPDPVTGDRAPVNEASIVARVKPPPPLVPSKGKKSEPSAPLPSYVAWALEAPGTYGLHFTPGADGLFELALSGTDPKTDTEGSPREFGTSFRLGVGSAAAQTEQSQGGVVGRRGTRRPIGVGGDREKEDRLRKLMEELGYRTLALEPLVDQPPAKGPHVELAARARELAALAESAKGLVPASAPADGAPEFDALAARMAARFEELARAAEGKDRKAPRAKYDALEPQGCLQCHAKYRWGVADDVTRWPQFEQKPWRK